LLFKHFRVIDVHDRAERGTRRLKMTFTMDADTNITAHGSAEEAAAATATPFDSVSSQQEMAELAAVSPTWEPPSLPYG
jgi:hypothetical protein